MEHVETADRLAAFDRATRIIDAYHDAAALGDAGLAFAWITGTIAELAPNIDNAADFLLVEALAGYLQQLEGAIRLAFPDDDIDRIRTLRRNWIENPNA